MLNLGCELLFLECQLIFVIGGRINVKLFKNVIGSLLFWYLRAYGLTLVQLRQHGSEGTHHFFYFLAVLELLEFHRDISLVHDFVLILFLSLLCKVCCLLLIWYVSFLC